MFKSYSFTSSFFFFKNLTLEPLKANAIKQVFLIFLLLVCAKTYSQSASGNLRKAGDAVASGNYDRAIQKYLATLKEDSLNFKANTEYGLFLIEYLNDPGKAGTYLLRAEKLSSKDTMPEIIYGLAKHYHYQNQYSRAIIYYTRTLAKADSSEEEGVFIAKEVKRSIENCRYAIKNQVPSNKKIKIINIGEGVNTFYPEYVPLVTKDDKSIMFTSRRENNTGNKIDDFDSKYFEDMFLATRNSSGKFIAAQIFSENDLGLKEVINTKDHDAVVSLSHSNNRLYIYRKNKIFESEYINNAWASPKVLGDSINLLAFQTHICISHDDKTVFFSCETPEKLGNVDIYKSERKANGKWSIPLNLGKQINTTENEESPFLSEDGKTLYFASKGHGGYGGYDMYKSTLKNGIWSDCENLGIPFNSSGDDIYLTINQNETQGYFSSSRAGGYGDMDIYEISYEGALENFSVDSLNRISINLPDTFYVNEVASFGVFSNKLSPSKFKRYYWQVVDSVLAITGEIANYTFTKTGTYKIRVQGLTSAKELIGYEKSVVITNRTLATVATNTTTTVTTNTTVTTTTVTTNTSNNTGVSSLEPIYFRFGQYDITAKARIVLMRNLKMLTNNPDAVITISAYCDSRGSSDYNTILSEKRAKAAAGFLSRHGLSKNRIKQITGFGDKDPLNKCADGTPCTAGEYKINRRVEFILHGK